MTTGSGLAPPKSNWALPIDRAPFHAYPVISSNVFTFGGLKVDRHARVLSRDGYPIPKLYAAGEIIVTMISDDNFNKGLQRTLLLQFALDGGDLASTAPQR